MVLETQHPVSSSARCRDNRRARPDDERVTEEFRSFRESSPPVVLASPGGSVEEYCQSAQCVSSFKCQTCLLLVEQRTEVEQSLGDVALQVGADVPGVRDELLNCVEVLSHLVEVEFVSLGGDVLEEGDEPFEHVNAFKVYIIVLPGPRRVEDRSSPCVNCAEIGVDSFALSVQEIELPFNFFQKLNRQHRLFEALGAFDTALPVCAASAAVMPLDEQVVEVSCWIAHGSTLLSLPLNTEERHD